MPDTPQKVKRYCGLGNHVLRQPHYTVKDQKIVNFAKHINREFRSTTVICGVCLDALKDLYARKMKRAIQLHRDKKKSQIVSFSDVSSSQPMSQNSASAGSSTSAQQSRADLQTAQQLPSSELSTSVSAISGNFSALSSTTEDEAPTTSAAARSKAQQPTSTSSGAKRPRRSDDDDDDAMLSLNAVNGTRLPHIQPIPKRRPTVFLNQNVMDIYLAGTTGG